MSCGNALTIQAFSSSVRWNYTLPVDDQATIAVKAEVLDREHGRLKSGMIDNFQSPAYTG
jgi:hypothetical protein